MAAEDDATTQQNTKEEKPDVQTMQIVVRAQDGSELQFKIKKSTPLLKMFNAYCTRKGLAIEEVNFLFEGTILQKQLTPDELEMEDGDVIDMMMQQLGGGLQNECCQ